MDCIQDAATVTEKYDRARRDHHDLTCRDHNAAVRRSDAEDFTRMPGAESIERPKNDAHAAELAASGRIRLAYVLTPRAAAVAIRSVLTPPNLACRGALPGGDRSRGKHGEDGNRRSDVHAAVRGGERAEGGAVTSRSRQGRVIATLLFGVTTVVAVIPSRSPATSAPRDYASVSPPSGSRHCGPRSSRRSRRPATAPGDSAGELGGRVTSRPRSTSTTPGSSRTSTVVASES
jgi:hypothetical protein